MKKINYTTGIVAALLLFNSCSDWLDVNPRSEMKESVMFSTEDGFKKALTGSYILLAQSDLYGKNTSMYVPELLARHYTIPATSSSDRVATEINRLSNFDYTHAEVEPVISQVWLNYYKVIVQLNDILQHLENSTVRFEHDNDALIRGEVLGLRAFLHLEVLRFFGPVPSEADPAGLAIPYITEKTKEPTKLISIPYSQVIKNIEDDLSAAEQILVQIDPILFYSNNILNGISFTTPAPQDTWQHYRQGRFNYFAVLGTKARFYQWTGNKPQALVYAQKVIDAVNEDGSKKFALQIESDYNASNAANLTMHKETLFSVHNPELQRIVEPLYKNNNPSLTQTVAIMNTGYENTIHPSDIRYKPGTGVSMTRYWEVRTYENSRQVHHFKKYTGNDQINPNNRVPLLRLAEMYLIMIENLSLGDAAPYFSEYRIARGLAISAEETSLTDDVARRACLEREHRKEFYGEGQMFFFYKRHKYAAYTWPASFTLPSADVYVLPKPQGQIMFE